jgi:hypothetical protein
MDHDGSARRQGLAYEIDFDSMNVVYEGGYRAQIVAMIDRFEDETDDKNEAEYILVDMPGDGLINVICVADLIAEGGALVDEKPH